MRLLQTALLLFITLLIIPLVTLFSDITLLPSVWHCLHLLLWVTGAATLYCFLVGELTMNNSQVDKLWSVLPVAYVWIIADAGAYSPRLILMALLVTVWGIRLTTNFAMKGAYTWRFWSGEEDYRWQVLRRKPEFQPRWKWTVFNFFFICGYQNALILLFTLPALMALQFNDTALGWPDFVVAGTMLFFIAFETIADAQQWRFQRRKRADRQAGRSDSEALQKGFADRGLWALSRHPNYFAEQSLWICFYFFSVAAGAPWFNWTVAGCLLLIILFQGSSAFGEEISAGKYPEYADYQERVPRFIPLGRRK